MKKASLLLGSALVLGGCGAAHGTREPNEYEQDRLDRLALIEEAGQPTLEKLVRAAQVTFFDENGNTISVDAFLKRLDTAHKTYREYYESGRIRIATDITDNNEEFGATFREAHNKQKSIVAFSRWLDPILWKVGHIKHEVGHALSTLDNSLPEHGHSSEVDNATDGSVANLAEVTWKYKDFPYALSILNGPTDQAAESQEADAEYYSNLSLEKVVSGEWTSEQAVNYYESWHAAALAEPWSVTATREFDSKVKEFMGWSDDEMIEAFDAGSLGEISRHDWELAGEILVEKLAEYEESQREKPTDRNYEKPEPKRAELLNRR